MKTNKFGIKEIKIKLMIVCILLTCVVLSFFFASEIESFLNLNETYAQNQVAEKEIGSGKYEVTYLDVGQGNCTFVKFPDGKTALIDGGNTMYGDKVVEFLKDKSVSSIDYMIASHADSDHIGGLAKVLNAFEVKNILRPFQIAGKGESVSEFVANESEDLAEVYDYYSEKTGGRSKISRVTSDVYNNFVELAYDEFYFENGKKIFSKVMVFYDGLKISGENYEIEFFAPLIRDDSVDLSLMTDNTEGFATVGYGADESNGNSAMFLLSCLGETFLFTGDASFSSGSKDAENLSFEENDFLDSLTNSERELISNLSVLIAGHHGSKYSTSEELLLLANPKFVVISVDSDNDYGHPHSEVISRILETNRLEEDYLLMTSTMGNISFSSINGEIKYSIELYESDALLTISWYELGTIIFISLSYIIVLIKPKAKRQFQNYWHQI